MLDKEDIKNLSNILSEIISKEKVRAKDFNTCCVNYQEYAKECEKQLKIYEVLQKKINQELNTKE